MNVSVGLFESAGLHRCFYLSVHCACREDVRMAVSVDEVLGESVPCPSCQKLSTYSLIGVGLTRRSLPFFKCRPLMQEIIHYAMNSRKTLGNVGETI